MQTTGSTGVGLVAESAFINGTTWGSAGLPYPHPPDNKLYVSRVNIAESPLSVSSSTLSIGYIRGTLPGVVIPCHNGNTFLTAGQTITGITNLPGRTFEAQPVGAGGSTRKWSLFETSNTW
jgi:hypothetical protein